MDHWQAKTFGHKNEPLNKDGSKVRWFRKESKKKKAREKSKIKPGLRNHLRLRDEDMVADYNHVLLAA